MINENRTTIKVGINIKQQFIFEEQSVLKVPGSIPSQGLHHTKNVIKSYQ